MLEAHIQRHFFDAADSLYQVAETLARPLDDAAQAAVSCLTAGGRLLLGGTGATQALVQLACAALMGRLERERPPLAALALPRLNTAPLYAPRPAAAHDGAHTLAQPLRAVGQPGDLLLLLALTPDEPALRAAVAQAHAMDISVIWCGPGAQDAWPQGLAETDLWIGVPALRPMRLMELLLLVVHALCDAIDVHLLGDASAA